MNVFYEDDGSFKVGHVMSDAGTSLQVEAPSGKRSKIKANAVVLRFESALEAFMPAAEKLAATLEPDFLWEVCGEAEFGCESMATDYFGHAPSAIESAAVAMTLHAAPMYFYKRGKGRYQAAPEENLKAALASIERKKREAEQMAAWVADLVAGKLPDEFRAHRDTLLYRPDRNTLMVKATEAAVAQTQLSLPILFFNADAWPNRAAAQHDFHLGKFLAEYFPRGRTYAGEIDLIVPNDLPLASVSAFSIDDAATTEIDDAFSIRHLPEGQVEVGIHIAAPTLFFSSDSALEKLANTRLSTVYFPGDKITMLPDAVIQAATLKQGAECPAVTLYATFDLATFALAATRTVIECVRIEKNLRIGALEQYFHEAAIAMGVIAGEYGSELLLLHGIAKALAKRRGKDDNEVDRVDYNFDVVDGRVSISTRARGNPIDTVVSELMIFANSEWGQQLAENQIAAIYRAQQNMKTRMTTDALPHEGLGVAQYAWSSSPLRRYVDLVNQRQLIAWHRGETPPYQKRMRDSISALSELARRFDLTYDSYNEFQRNLERYWCLKYLEQEHRTSLSGVIIRDELVRIDNLPLVVKLNTNPQLPAKTSVKVRVDAVDYWTLSGDFILEAAPPAEAPAPALE